jgi:RNA polymerase sigma-70 factor (ECF subfamily)
VQRDLVLRAKTGDHEAFTALAAAAIAELYRTARLILRDDDRANDAVQEALMTAWLDIRALREVERFDAWLRRILVRCCYREADRRRRREVREIAVDALLADVSKDELRGFFLRDQIDRGFRRLTNEQRAVLVVHHYLGLPDAEAAETLGLRMGTFKSRLNRATGALRAAIEADERVPQRTSESLA